MSGPGAGGPLQRVSWAGAPPLSSAEDERAGAGGPLRLSSAVLDTTSPRRLLLRQTGEAPRSRPLSTFKEERDGFFTHICFISVFSLLREPVTT